LKGAAIFASDLCRHLTHPHVFDYLQAHSYADTESTGEINLTNDITMDITGHHVLIVEDLIDTGLTLQWAVKHILAKGPASLRVAVLLDKKARRKPSVNVKLDFCGFDCPNQFIVGYGMDFNQEYRSLPFIGVLKPEAYKGPQH